MFWSVAALSGGVLGAGVGFGCCAGVGALKGHGGRAGAVGSSAAATGRSLAALEFPPLRVGSGSRGASRAVAAPVLLLLVGEISVPLTSPGGGAPPPLGMEVSRLGFVSLAIAVSPSGPTRLAGPCGPVLGPSGVVLGSCGLVDRTVLPSFGGRALVGGFVPVVGAPTAEMNRSVRELRSQQRCRVASSLGGRPAV